MSLPATTQSLTAAEAAAIDRLLTHAERDTGQSRRVANFLLAWWNAAECGGFDLTELWAVDEQIATDMQTVIALLLRLQRYPDTIEPELGARFGNLVALWRPHLLNR